MRGLVNGAEYGYGGNGNDLIQGSHKLYGIFAAWGGNGDDKIITGDEVRGIMQVNGGNGNDIIKAGDGNMIDQIRGTHLLYGDWS